MILLALKFGTTRFLAPHDLQKAPDVKGLKGFAWNYGDDAEAYTDNLKAMLLSSYENLKRFAPEFRDGAIREDGRQ